MNFPLYAKAIAGSFVGALASVGTTAATTGSVDSNSITATVVSAVAGFVLPYLVPNGKSPKDAVTAAAQGITVLAQVDGAAFLDYLKSEAPTLLEGAVQAALKGAPTPAADPAPTVEPAPEAAAPSANAAPVA